MLHETFVTIYHLSSSSSIFIIIKNQMAVFAQKMHTFTTIFLLLLMASLSTSLLDAHYYDKTCPQAEKIILGTVYNASMHDSKVPARILRMFFHDCFIRVQLLSLLRARAHTHTLLLKWLYNSLNYF